MPSAKEILQDLTGKQYIYLLSKGSVAIKEALGYVKEYTIILADQGGWLTYDVYAEKSNIVATDNGLVDPTTLEDYDDSYVLMVNSMAGYAFPQDMKELSKGKYMVINDATGSIGTENAKYGKYIIGSFGKAKPVNLGTGAFLASDEALNIQEDFDFDQEEKLTKLLKELPTRIKKLKTITKKVKKDLKHLNIIHPEKDGINIIVAYEQEKEKEEIISYCKENKYPFSECPRVIRVTQQAICVEVKRIP